MAVTLTYFTRPLSTTAQYIDNRATVYIPSGSGYSANMCDGPETALLMSGVRINLDLSPSPSGWVTISG